MPTMSKIPSLPDNPGLDHVFAAFPEGVGPLCEYHDIILRGPSEISVADRELIAAYVSGLNLCGFCYGAHRIFAEAQGIDLDMFEQLVDDPAAAGVDEKLLPLFTYARKLTQAPSSVTESDARAIYDAGWGEEALVTTVRVAALFNFMNRIIEGTGVVTSPEKRAVTRQVATQGRDSLTPYSDFASHVINGTPRTE